MFLPIMELFFIIRQHMVSIRGKPLQGLSLVRGGTSEDNQNEFIASILDWLFFKTIILIKPCDIQKNIRNPQKFDLILTQNWET